MTPERLVRTSGGPRSVLGLTLIEVLIAVAILAIGILGALALQTTSLQSTRQMSDVQALTQVAFRELEFQRTTFDGLPPGDLNCEAGLATVGERQGFECDVVVVDCHVAAGQASCPPVGAEPENAFLVQVTATGPTGGSVTLQRLLGERVFEDEE